MSDALVAISPVLVDISAAKADSIANLWVCAEPDKEVMSDALVAISEVLVEISAAKDDSIARRCVWADELKAVSAAI